MGAQTNKTTNRMFSLSFLSKNFKHERLLATHTVNGCMANEVQGIKMPDIKEKMFFKKALQEVEMSLCYIR